LKVQGVDVDASLNVELSSHWMLPKRSQPSWSTIGPMPLDFLKASANSLRWYRRQLGQNILALRFLVKRGSVVGRGQPGGGNSAGKTWKRSRQDLQSRHSLRISVHASHPERQACIQGRLRGTLGRFTWDEPAFHSARLAVLVNAVTVHVDFQVSDYPTSSIARPNASRAAETTLLSLGRLG
jgi:hypothetical protein